MNDFDIATLALLALGLVAGGVTKGFAGSGLPTVSVATMAIVIDVPTAVALMPIPLLVANARQAFRGGYMRDAMRRFWPLLVCLPFGTVLGVKVLTGIDARTVSGLVGAILVAFALLSQARFEWRVSARRDRQLQPFVGLGAGVIGVTTAYELLKDGHEVAVVLAPDSEVYSLVGRALDEGAELVGKRARRAPAAVVIVPPVGRPEAGRARQGRQQPQQALTDHAAIADGAAQLMEDVPLGRRAGVELPPGRAHVADILDDEMIFELIYRVDYTAHVSYDNPYTTLHSMETIQRELERDPILAVEVRVDLDKDNHLMSKISGVNLPIGARSIYVDEERFRYK